MDRFAFKIDKALKANLYKICRLCGIDNPDQEPILRETSSNVDAVDVEPEMSVKIKELIGFTVSKDDKMPQNICTMCVDKINDFYEFREMCYATNVQTRKLLGLKAEEPIKNYVEGIKCESNIKPETSMLLTKKGRKRKSDDDADFVVKNEKSIVALHKKYKTQKSGVAKKAIAPKIISTTKTESLKQESPAEALSPEIKEEAAAELTVFNKYRHPCSICNQRFVTKAKVEQHKRSSHIPNIPRYVCSTCNETFNRTSDIKTHQLWHKLSRTPYTCALCGECMLSSYIYTRHLREHCLQNTAALVVLDRECPQCHQTFVTNYLYNIHVCAVQSNKCPGCNRKLRNDDEYLRHAPQCAKVYLTHSESIVKTAEATESFVRIKNENDVEAAATAAALGLSYEMTPYVSLTRLSTPLAMSGNQCVAIPNEHSSSGDIVEQTNTKQTQSNKTKKTSKRGVTKEDIKRVDDLLKSTLDTLVSIKHEPEMHVESDSARISQNESVVRDVEGALQDEEKDSDNNSVYNDDHHNDDDVDEDAQASPSIAMKIKEEPIESHEIPSHPTTDKIPVLKLKIRKEHGTLNSSLVDDELPTAKRSEKKKKKKKHKDGERERDKEHKSPNKSKQSHDVAGEVRIKTEPANEVMEKMPNITAVPPVMTSIPMAQLQISSIASGVSLGDDVCHSTEKFVEDPPDIKPNRLELYRLLNINDEMNNLADQIPKNFKATARKSTATLPQITSVSSLAALPATDELALQSVGIKTEPDDSDYCNVNATVSNHDDPQQNEMETNGSEPDCNFLVGDIIPDQELIASKRPREIVTKKPHRSRKQSIPNKICLDTEKANISPQRVQDEVDEEAAYIRSIDFNNLQIKQEKEIDVYDVNHDFVQSKVANGKFAKKPCLTNNPGCANDHNQSVMEGTEIFEQNDHLEHYDADDGSAETDDYSSGSADEFESPGYEHIQEEEREYREMELPPLLQTTNNNDVTLKDCSNHMDTGYMSNSDIEYEANGALNLCTSVEGVPPNGLVITNVCSQANQPEDVVEPPSVNKELALKITDVTAAYDQFKLPIKAEPLDPDDVDNSSVAEPLYGAMQSKATQNMLNTSVTNTEAISVVPNALGLIINPLISSQIYVEEQATAQPFEPATAESSTMHFNITTGKESQLHAEPFKALRENKAIEQSVHDEMDVEAVGDNNADTIEVQQNMANAILDTASEACVNSMSCVEETTNNCSKVSEESAVDVLSATATATYIEETDNLNNENLIAALQHEQAPAAADEISLLSNANRDSAHSLALNNLLLDYNNINEIAENNNNANLERELLDEHVDVAEDANDIT